LQCVLDKLVRLLRKTVHTNAYTVRRWGEDKCFWVGEALRPNGAA